MVTPNNNNNTTTTPMDLLSTIANLKAKHEKTGRLIAELELTIRIRQEFELPMTGKLKTSIHQVQRDTRHQGAGHGYRGTLKVSHENTPQDMHVKNLRELSPELAKFLWDNYAQISRDN